MVERNGGKVADFDKYATLKDLEYRVATGMAAADKLKAQVRRLHRSRVRQLSKPSHFSMCGEKVVSHVHKHSKGNSSSGPLQELTRSPFTLAPQRVSKY